MCVGGRGCALIVRVPIEVEQSEPCQPSSHTQDGCVEPGVTTQEPRPPQPAPSKQTRSEHVSPPNPLKQVHCLLLELWTVQVPLVPPPHGGVPGQLRPRRGSVETRCLSCEPGPRMDDATPRAKHHGVQASLLLKCARSGLSQTHVVCSHSSPEKRALHWHVATSWPAGLENAHWPLPPHACPSPFGATPGHRRLQALPVYLL